MSESKKTLMETAEGVPVAATVDTKHPLVVTLLKDAEAAERAEIDKQKQQMWAEWARAKTERASKHRW